MQRDVRISHSVLPEELLQRTGGLGVDDEAEEYDAEGLVGGSEGGGGRGGGGGGGWGA